jgi:tripartite-type tricarboxylate transporter receptor subunit TctC
MPHHAPSRRTILTLGGAALLSARAVQAQRAFPNRPIPLVVAFAPAASPTPSRA